MKPTTPRTLPAYLFYRKTTLNRTAPSAAKSWQSKPSSDGGAPNPETLLGNPARMFPCPLTEPLNLDAAFAAGIPAEIPYPFQEFAGPYGPGEYQADYQTWIDWDGIVQPVVNYLASNGNQAPPPQECTDLASFAGDSFTYQGKVYVPGAWPY